MEYNKIYQGHALDVLRTFPDECVDCFVTSPPYWRVQNYETEPVVWANGSKCTHSFHNDFCQKCGAWRGELGAEPTPDLYISHLCEIFDEVKRVLKSTGTCWINIGDTYGGSHGSGGDHNKGGIREGKPKAKGNNYRHKCLVGIPERLVLVMQERGWIRRNTIIWHKTHCVPGSARDRFIVNFEYLYFFTKRQKYYFESGPAKENCVWLISPSGCRKNSFPKKLIKNPIKMGSPPDGVVLDCFVGTGTTCKVAKKLGRKYIGIDIKPLTNEK